LLKTYFFGLLPLPP
jgi:hypothetical protein